MSLFNRLKTGYMKLRGRSPLEIELHFLRQNIIRDEFELEEMDRQWRNDKSPCCPSCRFSPLYSELCDKQDRRRDRERFLLKRINGQ